MDYFVDPDSIVRRIWGKSETVLFIFAGASAEFALNRAVDWLYFTGRLPADPLARLFSTVGYAQRIIYLPYQDALATIDAIGAIHGAVETNRKAKIPQWAYRDVLYMLIYYTVKVYETFEGKLTDQERSEIFDVFYRMGKQMQIENLPHNYRDWVQDRSECLHTDLVKSAYTADLYGRYKQHLGKVRFWLLVQVQKIVCPGHVRLLLGMGGANITPLLLWGYKVCRKVGLDAVLRRLFLPERYKAEIQQLNMPHK